MTYTHLGECVVLAIRVCPMQSHVMQNIENHVIVALLVSYLPWYQNLHNNLTNIVPIFLVDLCNLRLYAPTSFDKCGKNVEHVTHMEI